LKETLVAILGGEGDRARGTGFDIFVRWKPLVEQAVGWQPDIIRALAKSISRVEKAVLACAREIPFYDKHEHCRRWQGTECA
jgi:hypothetical protein